MSDQVIIDAQLQFYRNGAAGCLFVAHAANNPEKYDWKLSVVEDTDTDQIRRLVSDALAVEEISTQSLIFPTVRKSAQLLQELE